MQALETHHAIEAVWQIESARLIAQLARIVGDVDLAEDLAQDALVVALEQWPRDGLPEKPAAWLMLTARHRAIDRLRRDITLQRKQAELGRQIQVQQVYSESDFDFELDQDFSDDLLRLIFTACHPVLSLESQVALTLRLLGGLTTAEIARAFLLSETTIQQRIVRAKRVLKEARVPFEIPGSSDRLMRLSAVLQVIYLIFNEGYSASRGEDWIRPGLCEEAMRLGRILVGLLPHEAEVHGLLALMELQASRLRARLSVSGEPILLLDQDRARWDRLLIQRGLAGLARAETLGQPLGTYTLQAAIAACHARARTSAETDWQRIAALYDALSQVAPSPIVELNRAVAVSQAYGPQSGLEIVDRLASEPSLQNYHLLPAVRGELLSRLGRLEEACREYRRAAALANNMPEHALLLGRAASCCG